jgi:hypothetical protein
MNQTGITREVLNYANSEHTNLVFLPRYSSHVGSDREARELGCSVRGSWAAIHGESSWGDGAAAGV